MKILIDCGAYTGDSLPLLLKVFGPFDRILCFEANARLSVEKPEGYEGTFQVLRAVVWHEDASLRFFLGEHDEQSSVMKNKCTGNLTYERSDIIPAINFSHWIENNTSPNDCITVKMDIEGAEFSVLESLINHPACMRIEHLLVEWHNNRLHPRIIYFIRRKAIELRFLIKGLPISVWGKRSLQQFSEHGNSL